MIDTNVFQDLQVHYVCVIIKYTHSKTHLGTTKKGRFALTLH